MTQKRAPTSLHPHKDVDHPSEAELEDLKNTGAATDANTNMNLIPSPSAWGCGWVGGGDEDQETEVDLTTENRQNVVSPILTAKAGMLSAKSLT
jgi:hypothetical protein